MELAAVPDSLEKDKPREPGPPHSLRVSGTESAADSHWAQSTKDKAKICLLRKPGKGGVAGSGLWPQRYLSRDDTFSSSLNPSSTIPEQYNLRKVVYACCCCCCCFVCLF